MGNDFKSKDAKSVKKFLCDIFGKDIDEHVKGESSESRGRGFEREGMESMKEELMKEIRGHIKELVNENRVMKSVDPAKPNTLQETIDLIPCKEKKEEVQSLYEAGEMDELKKTVNAYIKSYVDSEHEFNEIFKDYKKMLKGESNDDDNTSAFEEDIGSTETISELMNEIATSQQSLEEILTN